MCQEVLSRKIILQLPMPLKMDAVIDYDEATGFLKNLPSLEPRPNFTNIWALHKQWMVGPCNGSCHIPSLRRHTICRPCWPQCRGNLSTMGSPNKQSRWSMQHFFATRITSCPTRTLQEPASACLMQKLPHNSRYRIPLRWWGGILLYPSLKSWINFRIHMANQT